MIRDRICKSCGATYSGSPGSYYCPDCAARARSENVYRVRVCIDCGSTFTGYPKSKRCPRCRDAATAAREARYRVTGSTRHLGDVDQCTICGADYVVTGGLQRYCPKCAPDARRSSDNQSSRAWNAAHKEQRAPIIKQLKRQPRYCVVCGKEITSKTATVTCGDPDCVRKRKAAWRHQADYNRGKRKTPPPDYSPTK